MRWVHRGGESGQRGRGQWRSLHKGGVLEGAAGEGAEADLYVPTTTLIIHCKVAVPVVPPPFYPPL